MVQILNGIWNPEALPFEIWTIVPIILKLDHLKSNLQKVRISNVFDKMEAICPDFKCRISDTDQNPDHLQPKLFLTIRNPD